MWLLTAVIVGVVVFVGWAIWVIIRIIQQSR